MDFKHAMTEWVHLKAQLAAARKDIGTLNAREKELKGFISTHMKQNEIDTVKVQDNVKVNLKTKQTKGTITKDVIKRGLASFFVETRRRSREPGPPFRTQRRPSRRPASA